MEVNKLEDKREEIQEKKEGAEFDDKVIGKSNIGYYIGALVIALVFGIFGSICGAQISRAKRANIAIESAKEIYDKILEVEGKLQELKIRVTAAKELALDPKKSSVDFQFIEYLRNIQDKNPFPANSFTKLYYQALITAQSDLFNYYRQIGELWTLIKDHVNETTSQAEMQYLKEWSNNREKILKEFSDTKSNYGIKLIKDSHIIAKLGKYENLHEDKAKKAYVADWTPINGGEKEELKQYLFYEDAPDLSEDIEKWLIPLNVEILSDNQKILLMYGGPLVAKYQRPFLRYIGRLIQIEKLIISIETLQNNLKMALEEVSKEEPRFTFGL